MPKPAAGSGSSRSAWSRSAASRQEASPSVQVGFADQPFAFELVPLELMRDNPDNLDLAMPSVAFHVDELETAHAELVGRGVQATDVGNHSGTPSFAFSDVEGHWFAVTH